MPKTKTQAQKNSEKLQRVEENKAQRLEEKAARALEHQKQQSAQQLNTLNKKELRKQTKLAKPAVFVAKASPIGAGVVVESIEHKISTNMRSNADASTRLKTLTKATDEEVLKEVEARRIEVSTATKPARLVENHSTYCEGLRPVLIRLTKHLPSCTIIPGEISRVDANAEEFQLRFQRATDDHTYKFVARCGYTAQEVTVSAPESTKLTKDIICENIDKAITKHVPRVSSNTKTTVDVRLSNYNHSVHNAAQSFWKEEHKKRHAGIKAREDEIKKEKLIKEQSRKLATKNIPADAIEAYAERDVAIISGESRGKYSM